MLKKVQNQVRLPLVTVMLCLFVGATTLQYTTFMSMEGMPECFNLFRKAAVGISCLLIVLNGLCDCVEGEKCSVWQHFRYAFQQNIILVLLLLLSVVVSKFSGKRDLVYLVLLLGALRGIDIRFILKCYLIVQLILMAVIVSSALLGKITNVEIYRSKTKMRYALGYDYPSVTMTFVFFVIAAYVWLKQSYANWLVLITMGIGTIWIYRVTDARMGFFASLVILLFVLTISEFGKKISLQKSRFGSMLGKVAAFFNDTLVFWLLGAMIVFCFLYPDASIAKLANKILNKRVQYGANALETYGVPVFGQVIEWVGFGGEYSGKIPKGIKYNFVDCSYLQILLQYGMVWTLLTLVSISALLRKARKRKNWYQLFLLWMIVLYCFMEPRWLELHSNIFLCLLVPFLFPWDKTRDNWDWSRQKQDRNLRYLVVEQEAKENHAGAKARNDIAHILLANGWTPLSVTKGDGKGTLDKLRMCVIVFADWFRLLFDSNGGTPIIVQYPLATYPKVRLLALPFLWMLRYIKRNKIIYLIHDMDSMRLGGSEQKGELAFFRLAQGMISHNEVMTNFIRSLGISCPITEIGIFDYLTDIPFSDKIPMEIKSIAVAGNLNREKAGYLYKMDSLQSKLIWQIYGPNFEGQKSGRLDYRGQFPAESLPARFEAGFGLVWDGDSCETCSGVYGSYLRYNNPHKLSLYLVSGMPVIVWKESALAGFVQQNELGFAVDSLQEMEARLETITQKEYQNWKLHVQRMAKRLRNGQNTIEAAEKIVNAI